MLTECWLEKDYDRQYDDFDCFYFPRLKSRSVQGGGTVILIRNKFKKYISFEKNQFDTIIWLKISRHMIHLQEDLYVGCVYLPPHNSSFHQLYDCEVFLELEEQIATFMSEGKVLLLGDFNARTSNRDDFIGDDILDNTILKEVTELLTYELDSVLSVRKNPDDTVNDYGVKLLNMCKSSGLRILNGRHKLQMDSDFSFMGARGCSVVDYCISTPDIFNLIDKFIVSSFTTWSDHAPLHLQIQSEISTAISRYDSRTATSRTFKWNSNYIEEARNALQTSLNALYIAVETPEVECQETIDSAVDLFTTELSDVMAPLFELKNRTTSDRSRYVYSSRTPIDKPWVTPELKRMYCVYRNDLREFNSSKTRFMHQKLLQSKKAYKVLSSKLKRQYKRIDGNMLDYLRKYNPRAFYSRFHKRHKKRPNADPSIFFEHFKELVAHAPTPSADQSTTFEQTAFDELDCEISGKEILDSIHALKRDKSHGTGLLLNEYFIEFQNYILPIIHNLFNRIFTTGIFPRTWSESIIVPVYKKAICQIQIIIEVLI